MNDASIRFRLHSREFCFSMRTVPWAWTDKPCCCAPSKKKVFCLWAPTRTTAKKPFTRSDSRRRNSLPRIPLRHFTKKTFLLQFLKEAQIDKLLELGVFRLRHRGREQVEEKPQRAIKGLRPIRRPGDRFEQRHDWIRAKLLRRIS